MRKPEEIQSRFTPTSAFPGCGELFFVGIGGAGMSAIAPLFASRGYLVAGSDAVDSEALAKLRAVGIDAQAGHGADRIRKGMTLVVSDAIDLGSSPEARKALELGLPMFRRSQALGALLAKKRLIAVTGTHGKTTTSGMIAEALRALSAEPLAVIGAEIPQWGAATLDGEGEWAVAEACEAYDSFHDLTPEIVVLTNLEPDHLDFHGSYERLAESVARFASSAKALVYNAEDEGATEIAKRLSTPTIPYRASEFSGELAAPGEHNRSNAAGALAALAAAGFDRTSATLAIGGYVGAERRLQVLRDGEIAVVDDYAHHPTEIAASLSALRERFPGRRLIVMFQPHLYSRTKECLPDFAPALSQADYVFLTDIYPAREAAIPGISSALIAEGLKTPFRYIPSRRFLALEARKIARVGDVVISMGAGTITESGHEFARMLDQGERARPRVAVVYGGDSPEREISLLTGQQASEALRSRGYDAYLVDVTELLMGQGSIAPLIGERRPDLAFLAVHGSNAETGAIQGFFDLLHLPYTGSDLLASALCIDKQATKDILNREGIRTPEGTIATRDTAWIHVNPPLVVKPNAQGSTVGLTFVEDLSELQPAIATALRYDDRALIEERISGIEISVPVLGDRTLPAAEIRPRSGRYDFGSKYQEGATDEIIPAELPEEILKEAERLSLAAHRAMGCRGATRTDMIVRGNEIFVLEVNTLPGLTKTSLLPNCARAAGIEFEDLVEWIVKEALDRAAKKA